MKKVRILYVIDSLFREGTEKHLLEVVRRLPADRYSLYLYSFIDGPLKAEFERAGVRVAVFNGRRHGPFGLRKLPALNRFMKGRAFDVVHTYLVSADLWGRLAAVIRKTPVVLSSKRGFEEKSAPYRLLSRCLNRFTARILFVSDDLRGRYLRAERIPKPKTLIIRNGVDAGTMRRCLAGRGGAGTPAARKTVVMAARLDPVKDYPTLLRAVRLLSGEFADLDVLIAGDGPEKEKLVQLTRDLGLAGLVHFAGNIENALETMAAADLVVLTSRYEGSPNAVLEAMALGKAVVATAVGGVKEMIENGVDGLLVPAGSPEQLAEKMALLLRDPARARTLGAAARKKVLARFTIQETVRGYDALYAELTAGLPRRRSPAIARLGKKLGYLAVLGLAPFSPRRGRLPALTYHSLDLSGSELSTPPALFERQMRFLKRKGFRSIGCRELEAYLAGRERLPEKSLVLTFDEGYANFNRALPVLVECGFKALLFPVPGKAGGPAVWTSLDRFPTLTLPETAALPRQTVEIGSHSLSHPELPGLPENRLKDEVLESARLLEESTGRAVSAFAYPFGKEDAAAGALAAGRYRLAFGTRFGLISRESRALDLERVDANLLRDALAFRAFFSNYGGFCFLRRCWKRLGSE